MSLLLCAILGANAFDQTFSRGVEAYHQRSYEASVAAFEQLVDQGVANADVFYDLGNAYYRSGLLAPAIANYERALQLDPGRRNAQENLQRAVSQTERAMSRPQRPEWEQNLFFWHFGITRGTSLVIASSFWCLAWILLAVRLVRRWPYLRRGAAAALALAAIFGISWWSKAHPPSLAVAAEQRVPVRYGTRPDEMVRFELFAGDRVSVNERKDGWSLVETSKGERGWTEDNRLLFVGPPYTSYAKRLGQGMAKSASNAASAGAEDAVRRLSDGQPGYFE